MLDRNDDFKCDKSCPAYTKNHPGQNLYFTHHCTYPGEDKRFVTEGEPCVLFESTMHEDFDSATADYYKAKAKYDKILAVLNARKEFNRKAKS